MLNILTYNAYRCTLLDHAKHILLRDPDSPRSALFASVIHYDLLHWESNVCDYIFGAILGVMDKSMQKECDLNVQALPMLRNPDGSSIRRFDQVSHLTYLTTSRRLTLMFVWVYALGTGALMLPEPCRRPALVAIAAMQTIIIASQGRRAYSIPEWTRLLVDSAHECFAALEFLMKYKQDHDSRATATTFKPQTRYITYIVSHIC